jgi:hypothetical protein
LGEVNLFIRKSMAVLLAAGTLASCATRSDDIAAAYVSPVLYQNLTCTQLAEEAQRVSYNAQVATGAQNKQADQDAAAMAVGLIVFWPALFLARGDGAKAAEVGRLKGEMDAIRSASMAKKCGIQFETAPPAAKKQ